MAVSVGVSGQTPLGYQQLDATTAAGLTVPAGASQCVILTEDTGVRFRDDGTNPTASVGMPLPANVFYLYAGNLSAVKFIGGTIEVLFYAV